MLVRRIGLVVLLLIILSGAMVHSQEIVSSYLDDDTGTDQYVVKAEAGQQITVSTRAISGDLDTVLELIGPGGDLVAENDDADGRTLNSLLSYPVTESGKYIVMISNYEGSAGEYEMEILITNGGEAITSQYSGETFVTGTVSDGVFAEYPVTLAANEALIATVVGSGDLDTYLTLLNAEGQIVAENDDRSFWEIDSEIVYTSLLGGDFRVIVSNYPETAGDFRLTLTTVAAKDAPIVLRVLLTGKSQFVDTQHFRIHYTQEGIDTADAGFIKELGQVLEQAWKIQINQLGWNAPLSDGLVGGDERLDVYLAELITDEEGGDLGAASPELPWVDDESTPEFEERSAAGYVVLDNDYDLDGEDATRLMRATAAHEFHHSVQFAYDADEPMQWYAEATATWMETQTFPQDQDATGYIADLFLYPEVCFGVNGENDPTGGLLIYGEWLFLQSLVDAHGPQIVQSLWENIAIVDGWDALHRTLEQVNEPLSHAMIRFHAQNLLRDYDLAPEFDDARVWNESNITDLGRWDVQGEGIQELAANYFRLDLDTGLVDVGLVDAPDTLELWLIGIYAESADLIPLSTSATIDPNAYDDVYLMVFNHAMTDELENCAYVNYGVEISQGTGIPPAAIMSFDTRHYLPLE